MTLSDMLDGSRRHVAIDGFLRPHIGFRAQYGFAQNGFDPYGPFDLYGSFDQYGVSRATFGLGTCII